MNTEKYKSVAVPKDVWEMAQKLARANDRSVARQISWLIRQAHDGQDGSKVKEGTAS